MRLLRWLRWRTDRELEEEVQAHLDLETQSNIDRGLPPEEARFAKRRILGNRTLLQGRAREADPFGWLQPVLQDLRYAFRNLARNSGFTAVAILSLALGIGANTAIFTLINVVMLKSLPVTHPEELVVLTWNKAWEPNGLAILPELFGNRSEITRTCSLGCSSTGRGAASISAPAGRRAPSR